MFLAVIPKSEFFQYEVYSSIFNYIHLEYMTTIWFVSFCLHPNHLKSWTSWQIHHSSTSLVSSMLICQSNPSPTSRIFISHLHTLYSWYNDSITSIFHHRCFDITFGVRALLQNRVPRGHGDFCEDLLHFTSGKRRSLELLIFTTS